MSKVCQVTGKRPMAGNNVSHANNRTRRRFIPNLQVKEFYVPSLRKKVKIRLSMNGLRTIVKNGIEAVIKDMIDRGEKF